MPLPPLPDNPVASSVYVQQAYHTLNETHRGAQRILHREDQDPVRLRSWADSLDELLPLLLDMQTNGLSLAWISECHDVVVNTIQRLLASAEAVAGRQVSAV